MKTNLLAIVTSKFNLDYINDLIELRVEFIVALKGKLF